MFSMFKLMGLQNLFIMAQNKQVFYLNDSAEFFETIESDLITFVYRFNGQVMYSVALRELVEKNYCEN